MSQQQRVNQLAEGMILGFLTAGMGALAIYYLPVKFLVDFVWGIPIIIILKKYDLQIGLFTLVTTFIMTLILIPPIDSLLMFVILAPLALTFGLLFKYEITPGTTLLTGAAVSVLSTVIAVLILLNIDPLIIMPTEQVLRTQAVQSMALYAKLGLVTADEASMYVESGIKLVRTLIPSAFAIGSLIRAFFTYILAIKVLQKLNYRVPPLPAFSDWRLPWYSVWLLITGLGMSLAGDQFRLPALAIIGKNMVFIVFPLFLTIGTAVVAYFFKTWKISTWIKALLGIAAAVNFSGSLVLFTLIGIFDPLVSFRKWKRPAE